MPSDASPWSHRVRLSELRRGPVPLHLAPDEAERGRIAEDLGVDAVTRLEADVVLAPWLDGAELTGRWRATVVQTCGVSLDPFASELAGEARLRFVPPDSRLAVAPTPEVIIDPDAEDPPDVLEGDTVDVGAALLELVALEVDPFPRKPGVEYEPLPEEPIPSPFAALAALKRPPEGETDG